MIKIRIQTTSGDPKGWLRREFWHAQSSVYAILMQAICSHKCFKFFFCFMFLHVSSSYENIEMSHKLLLK